MPGLQTCLTYQPNNLPTYPNLPYPQPDPIKAKPQMTCTYVPTYLHTYPHMIIQNPRLQNRLVAGSDVVDLILYKRGRPPRVAKQARTTVACFLLFCIWSRMLQEHLDMQQAASD